MESDDPVARVGVRALEFVKQAAAETERARRLRDPHASYLGRLVVVKRRAPQPIGSDLNVATNSSPAEGLSSSSAAVWLEVGSNPDSNRRSSSA